MMHKRAFTLVELIVVITILAVLWTIAFVSFQWYAASSRDSVRVTDLKNIDKVLKLRVTAWESLLLPEKSIKLTASGTILHYQWLMWEKLLSHYWLSNWWLDPIDNSPYAYALNANRNKYQLLGFLETWNSAVFNFNKSFANNSERFPKTFWDSLWILLDESTNIPLIETASDTEIDIQSTTENYAMIIQNSTGIKKWDKEFLKSELAFRVQPKWSCKSLLLNGFSKWDGVYKINPTGSDEIEVYCDMTTDGWGWAIISWEIENEQHRQNLLGMAVEDKFTNSVRDDFCQECGWFPMYIRDAGDILPRYLCKEKYFSNTIDYKYIEWKISINPDHLRNGRKGMFFYDNGSVFRLRSEGEHDYNYATHIMCR
jgi:prepilin-type N-terminal cleavage/methylation domain-containing protein